MTDQLDGLVARVVELARSVRGRPLLVGLGGPVAVGKSTLANELAQRLGVAGKAATVVTTDGFLLSNAELDARGLTMRKGFPESFDDTRFGRFLANARAGAADLVVPRYSHLTYDVVAGEDVPVPTADVLIVEGVNVLFPDHIDDLDLSIYLDAPDDAVVGWFCARIGELCRAARDEPRSFFRPYAHLGDEHVETFARSAWESINAVNLEQHIRPMRDRADVVVTKRPDHGIAEVALRQEPAE